MKVSTAAMIFAAVSLFGISELLSEDGSLSRIASSDADLPPANTEGDGNERLASADAPSGSNQAWFAAAASEPEVRVRRVPLPRNENGDVFIRPRVVD
ncbi:hypothetical protein [Aurantiacibacter sediminis]|uniref:Uncharacterized protein n=1 Tax=Aurantiacibacter sediminis TaxID=2793064 RepID=A0ABS0N1N8_9SPHN|nr:hypothetical protein [Aurantiacibacter sediminis]MBH5321879.1 hypothetical protein [Aurantiacibacter sediminis]